jgi:hypothetical protein
MRLVLAPFMTVWTPLGWVLPLGVGCCSQRLDATVLVELLDGARRVDLVAIRDDERDSLLPAGLRLRLLDECGPDDLPLLLTDSQLDPVEGGEEIDD